jgi:hypothetical protein
MSSVFGSTYNYEDGNNNFFQNFGKPTVFDVDHPRKSPKLYTELQPRNPKDKNHEHVFDKERLIKKYDASLRWTLRGMYCK